MSLALVPQQYETATHHDGREGTIDPDTGGLWVSTPDGGLELAHQWWRAPEKDSDKHSGNLVHDLSEGELNALSDEICRGIEADEMSRKEYLDMTAEAVAMLGIKLLQPASGGSDAPMEGMSTVQNPLLLDCVIGFQADTVGEMLPSSGPAKIRNDGSGDLDTLAQCLEDDFNHYLTTTAREYYPDTDRGLFAVGHIGGIVKKVFRCARRKRPVSETCYLKDIIVDAGATDFDNAVRVTHQTQMTNADLRIAIDDGIYANRPVGIPVHSPGVVEKAGADALGIQLLQPDFPPDYRHTIRECYTKRKLLDDDVLSPYRITVERDSRQILEIRRNWRENDDERKARRVFVMWPYLLTSLGFYPLGLFHLLGNTNMALTAAWRMGQDAVMTGNFPGFLYSEGFGKQQTNNFRVPPGGGSPIQTDGKPLGDLVMPLPYKGLQVTMIPWIQEMQQVGQKLGGRAEIQVGEGSQNAPVGTVLAQIEQAMKPVAAVAKRLHTAQAEEFRMMLELFREDPEAFWRDNPTPAHPWDEQTLLQALDDYDLVPVSDPNTPSQMHRVAKALLVYQMAQQAPLLFEPPVTARWLMNQIKVDPDSVGLKSPEKFAADQAAQAAQMQGAAPGGKAPDPLGPQKLQLQAQIAQQKAQTDTASAQAKLQEQQIDAAQDAADRQAQAQEALVESQDRAADRASHEKIAELRLQSEREGRGHEAGLAAADAAVQHTTEQERMAHEAAGDAADRAHEIAQAGMAQAHDAAGGAIERDHEAKMAKAQAKVAGVGKKDS